MAVTLQERYSSLVDAKLRYSLVQRDGNIWNNRYEGDPKAGAVKIPVRDTEATVAQYNKESGVATSTTTGSFITATIDKDYAVNEVIDGYVANAVPDNLVADRLDSAGYSLALQMNEDATTELLKGDAMGDTAALTKDNVYEKIVDTRKEMSKRKIPNVGRFLLVTPDVMALILTAPEFIKASALGDEVVQSGAVGRIAGFTVYEDATIVGKKKNSNTVEFIAGHPNWCCRVKEWAVEPRVQDLAGSGKFIGASAVQGRYIYTHKVTKTNTVLIKAVAGK